MLPVNISTAAARPAADTIVFVLIRFLSFQPVLRVGCMRWTLQSVWRSTHRMRANALNTHSIISVRARARWQGLKCKIRECSHLSFPIRSARVDHVADPLVSCSTAVHPFTWNSVRPQADSPTFGSRRGAGIGPENCALFLHTCHAPAGSEHD